MPTERVRKPLPTSSLSVDDIRAHLAEATRGAPPEPMVPPGALAVDAVTAAAADTTTDTRTSTPRAKTRATKEN